MGTDIVAAFVARVLREPWNSGNAYGMGNCIRVCVTILKIHVFFNTLSDDVLWTEVYCLEVYELEHTYAVSVSNLLAG